MEGGDWRSELPQESRQRIVINILNSLVELCRRETNYSLSGQGKEGRVLQELKKIAILFEEKMYKLATSRADYLRKISLKMMRVSKLRIYPQHMHSDSQSMQSQVIIPNQHTSLQQSCQSMQNLL